ncbi:MAG: EAL domain-containing protein [Gammaproteobacteria bacterium]|nr:EAL domain-containing protein [Gammaproteobacteria bacterium]MBU1623696.1 EAL domain-containing protein [Gammaproteobacteria bacterium]
MSTSWDFALIALSILIAVVGSLTALTHARRMRDSSGRTAIIWMLAGGSTLGLAIWSMHFVGMLAMHLPIAIGFDLPLTLLSLLPAVIAAMLAFRVLRSRIVETKLILISAVLMGVGISSMHYMGMAALQMSPAITYDPIIFIASVLIAIGASWGALYIMYHEKWVQLDLLQRLLLGGVLMGLAISAMHYVAMLGMHIQAGAVCRTDSLGIEPHFLAVMLSLTVLLLFGGGLTASLFDHRMARKNAEELAELEDAHRELQQSSERDTQEMISALRESEERLRMTLQSAPDAVFITEQDGHIVYVNDHVVSLLGYERSDLYEMTVFDLVPEDWRGRYREGGRRIVGEKTRQVMEVRLVARDGSLIPMELNAVLLPNGRVYGSCRDIRDRKSAERALQESQKQLQMFMDSIAEGMYGVDTEGRCTFVNEALLRILGYDFEEELLGKNLHEIIHYAYADGSPYPAQDCNAYQAYIRDEATHSADEVFWRKNGKPVPVEYWSQPMHKGGRTIGAVVTFLDISERKKGEEALHESVSFSDSLLQTMPVPVFHKDTEGRYTGCNNAFAEFIGKAKEEIIGKTVFEIAPKPQSEVYRDHDLDLLTSEEGVQVYESNVKHADGGLHDVIFHKARLNNSNGEAVGIIGVILDITDRKQSERDIHQLAFYDSLTQLPNRRLLMDRALQALAVSARSSRYGALMLLDLDDFKKVNDSKGHDVGDQLLCEVARRLRVAVREGDTVARLGGDEFVVVLEELSLSAAEAAPQAEVVAEKIRNALNEPYLLDGIRHLSSPSIGVVLYRGHEEAMENLLKFADIAMYQSKQAGRNTIRFYDPAMQAAIDNRLELESELDVAIKSNQLQLYYQVQVDGMRRPLGAEVLMRWQHPQRGLVSPAQFIPLAEETGQIEEMGMWALRTACQQLKSWQQHAYTRHLTLAVNVSARQFRKSEFVDQVRRVLLETGVRPSLLKLELTESTVLLDVEDTIDKMRELKLLGISFSMDDFGTGYSSLQYLKRLPLDQIKIDQSFVRDIASDPNDAAIVQTIIAMTEALGLNVIAEGVETPEQQEFLELRGCHSFQGYLFGRPLPLADFEAAL